MFMYEETKENVREYGRKVGYKIAKNLGRNFTANGIKDGWFLDDCFEAEKWRRPDYERKTAMVPPEYRSIMLGVYLAAVYNGILAAIDEMVKEKGGQ
jgi:hypothetical protein